ncbi:hypothetical protein DFH08DRAFT_829051 [Mycena albidolilacea]|uniref:Uncharacterized protein n=1 Tax=Mycena albidolilacea TaxID=1033008 RepID=A0AAD7F435_9AGAR|nr:hypothetical protein DFH08DRAFT_829051 [Mycena albidolilacea]
MSDPWDAHNDIYYENMIANERPVPKPSWTFPSPFFPYAVATYMVRDPIAWGPQPRTLAELRMYALSWAIRSKPEWQRKIDDASIIEKWRKEALDQQADLPVEERLTPNMVNYVLTELAAYARLSDPVSGIECGPFDAIWYSDRLIPTDLADRLRTAVAGLESVPDESKDWHPGSNGQVLDLVHPSLYCIVYGRTHFRDNSNFTPFMPPPGKDGQITAEHSRSGRYSWLPSDFSVATDGSVKLTSSYINNLHPTKQKPLYPVVEAVISSFVPLFERVLSQINGEKQDLYRDITPGFGRIKVGRTYGTWAGYNAKYCGISVPCIWVKADELSVSRKKAAKFLPEAFEEYTGELEKTIVPYSLRGRTIQCIVKLANIHLTVDNPKYPGGSWHVEGMLNERIVASGIYYYDEENITESQLAFRVTTGAPVYHEQDDDKCMDILYGLKRDTPCYQDLGSVVTSAGRALAWPNIYQHRVSPFRLLDPTKPGHRKIIAIFLVDPSINPIASATNIPPQQSDWVFEALEDPTSTFARLPSELAITIQEGFSDGLMSRAEAEYHRLELMKERTQFIGGHGRELKHSFNMCEH